MKVGIQTFHATLNYGAILQTYALQKYLVDIGVDCEVIDYKCEAIINRENPMSIHNIHTLKDIIKYLVGHRAQKIKHQRFRNFVKDKIIISEKSYDRKDISYAADAYDLIIVGSDQVWNLNLTGEDYSFFLDYLDDNTKKCSYAASFGYDKIPIEFQGECGKLLQLFRHISVRETEGARIIKELIKRDVQVVLDPTFLIDRESWANIAIMPDIRNKYILVYFIHNGNNTFNFIKSISKKTGCKIIYINNSRKLGMENINNASPCEFLGLIFNAKYIVTGSFHGVALSINFNKQFFYERAQSENNYNSRIDNIISLLALEKQNIQANDEVISWIDYNRINKRLKDLRIQSFEYINQLLEIINYQD